MAHWMKQMPSGFLLAATCAGCTTIERAIHLNSAATLKPSVFQFTDGAQSLFYEFGVNAAVAEPDTALFLLGGTGCASWKALLPHYVSGFERPVRIFALNKRHIDDRSLGVLPCTEQLHCQNDIDQWVSDYQEIISTLLARQPVRSKNVLLVGVSEGAIPAALITARGNGITHLAFLGFSGWSIRRSMERLYEERRGETHPDEIAKLITIAPQNIDDEVNATSNTPPWRNCCPTST